MTSAQWLLATHSFTASFLICGIIPMIFLEIYGLIQDIKDERKKRASIKRIDAMMKRMSDKPRKLTLHNTL